MDVDVVFVSGCVILVFAIPAIVSAYSDGRIPRYPAIIIMIGGVMIFYAITERPGAYSFETLPDVFLRVVAKFMS